MSLTSRLSGLLSTSDTVNATSTDSARVRSEHAGFTHESKQGSLMRRRQRHLGEEEEEEGGLAHEDFEMKRPPYLHAMLAGGIGGTTGDAVMHSLDTVKTRQQGDPHFPPKYSSLSSSYRTILREEGFGRGLYGGFTAAMLGSFPGTVLFFGTYEYTKRRLLDAGLNPSFTFLTGGFLADLVASILYVPSEVLKTRLQLQGRYNNPFFISGYNYRSTWDAAKTIARQEGPAALYSGYKATIVRDLPFSAIQFAIYEQEQRLAKTWVGHTDIGLGLEIITAASAGGIAGVLTCPLDVVKTRTQTQINPQTSPNSSTGPTPKDQKHRPIPPHSTSNPKLSTRPFHASSGTIKAGATILDTSSVTAALKIIYKTEGIAGCFRGVGPRGVWTSVQSGTMLVLYQYILKELERLDSREGSAIA